MKRRRFPILAILSSLLCLAFIALWIRSHYVCDMIFWDQAGGANPSSRTQWAVASRAGCIDFGRCEYRPDFSSSTEVSLLFATDSSPADGWHYHKSPRPPNDDVPAKFWNRTEASSFWTRLGFDSNQVIGVRMFDMGTTFGGGLSGSLYTLPYWLLILAMLILPAIAAFRHIRGHKRTILNLCPHCGYDLRSHTPGQKCPECGTEIGNKIAAASPQQTNPSGS